MIWLYEENTRQIWSLQTPDRIPVLNKQHNLKLSGDKVQCKALDIYFYGWPSLQVATCINSPRKVLPSYRDLSTLKSLMPLNKQFKVYLSLSTTIQPSQLYFKWIPAWNVQEMFHYHMGNLIRSHTPATGLKSLAIVTFHSFQCGTKFPMKKFKAQ